MLGILSPLHFLVYFLQAYIMWWHTKNDKYMVWSFLLPLKHLNP